MVSLYLTTQRTAGFERKPSRLSVEGQLAVQIREQVPLVGKWREGLGCVLHLAQGTAGEIRGRSGPRAGDSLRLGSEASVGVLETDTEIRVCWRRCVLQSSRPVPSSASAPGSLGSEPSWPSPSAPTV